MINYEFLSKPLLLLLLLVPLAVWWYMTYRKKRFPTVTMSSLSAFEGMHTSMKSKLRVSLPILRSFAFIVFVIAIARPRLQLKEQKINVDAIDIVLVMDLSSSMLARDFEPDRLEASKEVAIDFVKAREYDRIGLVVFAGEAFTQCPITTDHKVVNEFLGNLQCGILADGTAIGMGLATAVNRLKESEAESKVVILLTDGVNNSGYIPPMTAAEIAEEFDVKVYTIGVGSTGEALTPIGRRGDGEYLFGYAQVEIDEQLLEEIATMTDGRYYRATNKEALEAVYQEIDQLEKTEIEQTVVERYSEEFPIWVLLGILFLAIEFILRYTVFRMIP